MGELAALATKKTPIIDIGILSYSRRNSPLGGEEKKNIWIDLILKLSSENIEEKFSTNYFFFLMKFQNTWGKIDLSFKAGN